MNRPHPHLHRANHMLSYVLPTHNRPERLQRTLDAIGELDAHAHETVGGAEVIVVDNASNVAPALPGALRNRLRLRALTLKENRGAAARNQGAHLAQGEWIIMLDDDSYPLDCGHIDVLQEAPDDIAAIGAEIRLPDGSRERGGLPEVFIGCGVAIRRAAFLDVGGYDATFDYYAEEYDLSAKLLQRGWKITQDARFRVRHEKISAGRDFNRIVHRLVRNNAWVVQRYAPETHRAREIVRIIERYAQIALHEGAAAGFAKGMSDLATTLTNQPRTPMTQALHDRFTGRAAVREHLASRINAGDRIALADRGKNAEVIEEVLKEMKAHIVTDAREADTLIVGTLSPGPMLDALERWQTIAPDQSVITPWNGQIEHAHARCE